MYSFASANCSLEKPCCILIFSSCIARKANHRHATFLRHFLRSLFASRFFLRARCVKEITIIPLPWVTCSLQSLLSFRFSPFAEQEVHSPREPLSGKSSTFWHNLWHETSGILIALPSSTHTHARAHMRAQSSLREQKRIRHHLRPPSACASFDSGMCVVIVCR